MFSLLLSLLLYRTPKIVFKHDEIEAYEKLLPLIKDGNLISYECPYPKYRFLHYLSLKETFLFHGSNHCSIEVFEPREQTLYDGKLTKSVFASSDAIWPFFYATFDRNCLIGSFRNGCVISGTNKYHYYSLNESTIKSNPWINGQIYILPREQFNQSGKHEKVQFDEWICDEPVKPFGKLNVEPNDFYFMDKVATHKDKESLLKTWLFYKARTILANTTMRDK